MTRLVANAAVKSYIGRHALEILEHFELVVNTVSMEEALQQKAAEAGNPRRDAGASLAAYIADTMGDGEDGAAMDPENEGVDGDNSGDTAGAEPVDGGGAEPEGVAPNHGAVSTQAAE